MDLSKLTKKTLQVSRGFTYSYYLSPARGSKPTLILFHGWPDTAKLWAGLINNYLIPNGYGIIAIDCLGYGDTSKPTELSAYAWHHMAADAVEIINEENLPSVISVGHDWGSAIAQRLYNFYPSRVSGLIMVNVAYVQPTGEFDLDLVNKITREAFGHGIYEYFHFYCANDSTPIMSKNVESVYTVAHGKPETWLDNWCSPGGMRKYITEGCTQPVLPYATGEHRADFFERFGKPGAFDAPSCWYKAFTFGIQSEADKLIPSEGKIVTVPAFFWGAEKDFVCRPAVLQPSIDAGLLTDIESVTREGGHWALLDNPVEFGQDILGWLEKRFVPK